jgi:N6-L-threonylcarbamoyladenine synthase
MTKNKRILGLGLESSCDETAAAVIENGVTVLSNRIASQINLHSEYFGVVPEIASRAHLEVINGLIEQSLDDANISIDEIDYVAATNRPGLIGSLLIALQNAKIISYIQKIPLIAVNHLEAHLYSPFLDNNKINYPYIGLIVSGGNTSLYIVHGISNLELLGKTTDDAIGEAYDKVSKFMQLGYPGGPIIDKLAKDASEKQIHFPKLLAAKNDTYQFSYSGLKTAVINEIKKFPTTSPEEIAHAFQESALELLIRRTFKAARDNNISTIVVAGGVAANSRLRELFFVNKKKKEEIFIPSQSLCTDNGAMIGGVAYHYFAKGQYDSWIDADCFSK